MGYSQRWLASRDKPREALLQALGLQPTGEREEFAESPIVGAALPGGGYVVIANRSGHPRLSEDVIRRLSDGAEIVVGDVEEHVMVSQSEAWRDGVLLWSILHDAQHHIGHLETDGDLPEAFQALRETLTARQQSAGGDAADVDYLFDVPVEWARTITGYRHDAEFPGVDDAPFEVLAATESAPPDSTAKKPIWKRLLGR